jgi:hypothetical protein
VTTVKSAIFGENTAHFGLHLLEHHKAMPLREMSAAELEDVYRSFEQAGVMLSTADKAALKIELQELAWKIWDAWRAMEKTHKQMEKEMRTAASLSRKLANVLGEPPKGPWLEGNWTPIVDLPEYLADVYAEKGRRGVWPYTFDHALKTLYELLGDVGLAAERAADRRLKVSKDPEYNWRRGHDRATTLLLLLLSDIWVDRTRLKLDAWVDAATGERRGNFWQFAWASSVLCREFVIGAQVGASV